jgi:hypothetical protein
MIAAAENVIGKNESTSNWRYSHRLSGILKAFESDFQKLFITNNFNLFCFENF